MVVDLMDSLVVQLLLPTVELRSTKAYLKITEQMGGTIFATEQDSIINMSGNVFVSNKAIIRGGVLYSDNSTITVSFKTTMPPLEEYWLPIPVLSQ